MEGQIKNTACVLNAINDIRLEERPIPSPKPFEVLVSMKSIGICGSDVHYWTHGRIGDFVVKAPMILGHESSGIIVDVGAGVTHLKKKEIELLSNLEFLAECVNSVKKADTIYVQMLYLWQLLLMMERS